MPFSTVTTKSFEELFHDFKTSTQGLTREDAAQRLIEQGPNAITSKELHWWDIWLRQFQSSFIYLLLIAAATSLALGETTEGVLMLIFVGINTTLGFYQEYQSERSLQLLKRYFTSTARVMRNGQETVRESRELVTGDVVIVEAGDRIPADLRFFEARDLAVDESALSGESTSVEKIAEALPWAVSAVPEAKNIGFSGATVVSGEGRGVVIATGARSVIGEVSRLTVETHRVGQFAKDLRSLSVFIIRLVILTLALLFIANIALKGRQANIPELFIFSLVLMVSIVPEALPVVTTVALSRGAIRLARHKVVVKRLAAIEDLGSIEVLCTDKTGTITENKLTVADVYGADRESCLRYAALAASPPGREGAANAFDIAVQQTLTEKEQTGLAAYRRLSDIPFDPGRRRHSVLVEKHGHAELVLRGAPETILGCCVAVTAGDKARALDWMAREGTRGRRVLAVAMKPLHIPEKEHHISDETGMTFLGLISFVDPLKSTAKHAIERAHTLGIQIKILTGDSREVAGAVAQQIGLTETPGEVMMGEAFDALSPEEQHAAVETYRVFARVSPEQKYRIVQLLQERFEVGFLGEGINDAPALKLANVGLVVQGAADIARDAADVVLLQKSLDVIVNGVKQGRLVFANIIKYIKITLTSNFGNFYSVGVASLLIPFLPILPIQVLLLNLVSDFPLIAISTDTVESTELQRPKHYQIKDLVLLATVLGLVSSLFDFIFFGLFYRQAPAILQTNWFIGGSLTELVLIFSLRTHLPFFKARLPSWSLAGLCALGGLITVGLPFTRFGQRFFEFVQPKTSHLVLVLVLVAAYFAATESVKLMYERSTAATPSRPRT